MKTTFQYDHYYKYDELKDNLETLAKNYPNLMDLEVNCVSEENRNQYVAILTNKETGGMLDKPGWYIDGNIHAGEVTSTMCAMHTIDYLLTNYGSDETVTKILDTTTIYAIPRVSPDGAETYLSTAYTLRSVNRDYLPKEGGVKEEDIDEDGVIRMMRIKTPYGAWKIDEENPGSMTLRSPSDQGGTYYDIYPEGLVEDDIDTENLKKKQSSWGLDFNRNFPYGWMPNGKQDGAGKYPLSNIETKAIADFVLAHPNICGAAIGHTSGGLVLYPPGTHNEKELSYDDLSTIKAIAKMGEEEMNYKPINIFGAFISDQTNVDSGALDDWMFESFGIPAYTIEFWDLASKAGVPIEWGDKEINPLENLKRFNACMKWVKENAPQYYSDWKEFEHPTLGSVEIGGFNYKFTHQNPPEDLLLKECENDTKFNLRFMQVTPKLVIDKINVEKLADDLYQVDVVVGNVGYLSSNLTDIAINMGVNKPVEVSIDASVVNGDTNVKIGDLAGYSKTKTGVYFYGNITTLENAKAKKKVSWLVKGKENDTITVCASHEKAGKVSAKIELK